MAKEKRTFRMPHLFILFLIIMLIIVVLSYIIPSGTFERFTDSSGNEVVNPDNFQYIENENPIGFMDFFKSIFTGIVEAGEITVSLLLCAGVIQVLDATGSFGAAIHKMLSNIKGKQMIVLVGFYTFFALTGIIGYGEGAYPFYAITVAVIMSLGYDRIVGAAVIMISSWAGFSSGMLNLFTTGVSQNIVGLPLFSGMWYRGICFIVFYAIGLASIIIYCNRVKKNPEKSYVREEYKKQLNGEQVNEGFNEHSEMNHKHIIALIGFLLLIVLQGYGSLQWGWGMGEIAAAYIVFSIPLAILFKMNSYTVCENIVKGASGVLAACFAIGLARSVMVLMTQAQILDTIVYKLGSALQGQSPAITLLLIILFVTALNFFVISGSGKAMIMMPILSPLGKMLGINQQVMVLSYQFGDGFTNGLWPAGALIGCSLCKLEYGAWFRFAWWSLGAQIVAGYVLVVIADAINLGPF